MRNNRFCGLIEGLLDIIGLALIVLIGLYVLFCTSSSYTDKQVKNETPVKEQTSSTQMAKPEMLFEPLDFTQSNVSESFQEMSMSTVSASYLWSEELSQEDKYMLAKIAMAEAEGESVKCKVHIILVVLNRVQDAYFPDTIEEVIFQNRNGVYQFTPISDGRWYRVEPNEECWEALRMVMELEDDISEGALYFESCKNKDNWHSRNLQFLYEIDGTRFYK